MIIEDYVDAVIGLQYGDEGKGKVTASLADQFNYDFTVRYNGGPNAGHSIRKQNGADYALHQLPSSIAYQKPGYIAPGCVLDFKKLMEETSDFMLVEGFDPLNYLYIHPEVPLIELKHLIADKNYHYSNQGSTASGIAPAYSEYYNRTGKTFKSLEEQLQNYIFLEKRLYDVDNLLLEGAQGFYLNPEAGNYPYTTSSNSSPASASATLGFSPSKFRNIVGVAKCYETRSGEDPTFYNNFLQNSFKETLMPFTEAHYKEFESIQVAGKEYGVTTGRKRKVRFLCLNRLVNSIQSTGTNIVVLNKWDILEKIHIFRLVMDEDVLSFENSSVMFNFIKGIILSCCPEVNHIIYSASPYSDINWKDYIH